LTDSHRSAILFGPAGQLGPIWKEALQLGQYRVIGAGLSESREIAFPGKEGEVFIRYDVRDPFPPELIEELKNSNIEHAVVNSGVDSLPGSTAGGISDFSIDSWKEIFDVNVFGVVNVINELIKHLETPPNITLIGSMYTNLSPRLDLYSHFDEGRGSIKHPAYSASKTALLGVLKQYSTHLATRGIRINMLSPGAVAGNQDTTFVKKIQNEIPIGRLANSQELVSALSFLVNPSNSYLTGQEIRIDGGYSAW
jgi:NAD(P)-dependent dehydrogenase (short-subunit alcohol dehydrogenase family)